MVLTRETAQEQPGLDAALGERLEREWRALQAELTHLSSQGVQVVAEGGGHFLHWDTPEQVVGAIERVVMATRNARPVAR